MYRLCPSNFNRKNLRLVAPEILERRAMLSVEVVIATRPPNPPSQKPDVADFRFQFQGNASFTFGKSAASESPGGLFVGDSIDSYMIAGDWGNYGFSNLGAVVPNRQIEVGKIVWQFALATDRDPHVDIKPEVGFKYSQFDKPNPPPNTPPESNTATARALARPFAGNFDGLWGDEFALAYRLNKDHGWSWKINYGLNQDGQSWKYFVPASEVSKLRPNLDKSFGGKDSTPHVGDFDGDGISDIAVSDINATTQIVSLNIAYGPDFSQSTTKTLQTNIPATDLSNPIQIAVHRESLGQLRYSAVATGTPNTLYIASSLVSGSRTDNEQLTLAFTSQLVGANAQDQVLLGNWSDSAWTLGRNPEVPPLTGQFAWSDASHWIVPVSSQDVVLDQWGRDFSLNIAATDALNRTGATVVTMRTNILGGAHRFGGVTSFNGPSSLSGATPTFSLTVSSGSVDFAGTTTIDSLDVIGEVTLSSGTSVINNVRVRAGGKLRITGGSNSIGQINLDGGELLATSSFTATNLSITSGTASINSSSTVQSVTVSNGTLTLGELLTTPTLTISGGRVEINKSQAFTALATAVNLQGGTIAIGYGAAVNPLGTANVTVTAGSILSPAIPNEVPLASATNFLISNNIALNGELTLGNTLSTAADSAVRERNSYLRVAGLLSGTGGLRKTGSGTAYLTGNNTYSGTTTIDAGELLAGSSSALGTTSGTTQINGGILGVLPSLDSPFTVAEALVIGAGGIASLRQRAGLSGAITLQNNAQLQIEPGSALLSTVTLSGTGIIQVLEPFSAALGKTVTITTPLTGTGDLTWSIPSGYTAVVSGPTSRTGATRVQAGGTLELANGNAIPNRATLELLNRSILNLNGQTLEISGLSGDGSINLGPSVASSGQLTLSNTTPSVFAGSFAGNGNLTKAGIADLTLNGVSTFTGTTRLNQGRLIVGAIDVLSNNSNIIVGAGAELNLGFSDTVAAIQNQGTVNALLPSVVMSVTGDFINEAGATLNLGARASSVTGSLDNSGTVNLSGTDLVVGGVVLRAGTIDDPQRSGSITSQSAYDLRSGTVNSNLRGNVGLTKSSLDTVIIGGQNSFLGNTTIQSGTLSLTSAGALPRTVVTVQNAILLLNGNNQVFEGLSGSGQVQLGAAILTVEALNPTIFEGTITGTGGIRKAGNGRWTLRTANSFTGGVEVFDGSLQVDGVNSLGSGPVQVQTAGTLNIAANQTLARLTNAGNLNINTTTVQLSGDLLNTGTLNPSNSTFETTGTAGTQTIDVGSAIGGSLLVSGLSTVQLNSSSNNLTLNTVTVRGGDLNAGSKQLAVQSLVMDSATATLRGTGSISSATTFELRAGTVSIPLSGPSGVRKSTAANVLLTTANSYAGSTTVEQGTLNVQTSGGLGTGAVDILAAGTLTLAGIQTIASATNNGTFAAGGATLRLVSNLENLGTLTVGTLETVGTSASGQRLSLGNTATLTNLTTVGSSTVQLITTSPNITLNGTLHLRSGSLDAAATNIVTGQLILAGTATTELRGTGSVTSTNTYDLRSGIVAMVLSGAAGLRKSTAGTVRLDIATAYAGNTEIVEGNLAVNFVNAISKQSPILVSSLGTLVLGDFAASVHSISNQGIVQVGESELAIANDLVNSVGGTFDSGRSKLVLSGNLQNQGNWPSNSSTLDLSGVAASQRLLSGGASFDDIAHRGAGELVIEDATRASGEFSQASGNVRLAGGDLNVGSLVWVQGELSAAQTSNRLILDIAGSATFQSGQINAPIQGGSIWTKTGTEELVLSAPMEYALRLIVNQGELRVSGNGDLPDERDLRIAASGTLSLQSGSATFANIEVAGTLNLGPNTLIVRPTDRSALGESIVAEVSGTIAGENGLRKLGTGTLTWSGVNNIAGIYRIDAGQFVLRHNASLAANSRLNIALSGIVRVAAQVSNSELIGDGELEVTANSTLQTRSGQFAGTLRGAGSITKQGPENLVLTGESRGDFTGGVNVVAGGLVVNGTLPSAKVTVSRGALLAGRGQLGDTTITNGATLSPGNSPGKMQLASLLLEPGGSLIMELDGKQAGTSYDQIVVNGKAQLDGSIVVRFSDSLKASLLPIDFFDLITFGSMSGTPSLSFVNGEGSFRTQITILPTSYRLEVLFPTPIVIIDYPDENHKSDTLPEEFATSSTNHFVAYNKSANQSQELDLELSAEDATEPDVSQWLDRSESLATPPSEPIAESDITAAAIDSALAEGLTFESPSIASDMKPLTSENEAIELPRFNSPQKFPDWEDPDDATGVPSPMLLIASGLTSSLLGLAAARIAWLNIKRKERQKLADSPVTLQPNGRRATKSSKPATTDSATVDSALQEESTWTTDY